MGYDLTNDSGGSFDWKSLGWWHLLCIAQRYGWTPAGTVTPDDGEDEWDGNYFHSLGQQVTAADAAALAAALRRFADDARREEVAGEVAAQMQRAVDSPPQGDPSAMDMIAYPLEFVRGLLQQFGHSSVGRRHFDAKGDRYLAQFIEFCGAGAFKIE